MKSCDTCKWNDPTDYDCLNTKISDCCEPRYEGWEPIEETLAERACPTATIKQNNYHKIAKEIADLVEEKNKAYGNAAGECHLFLELLYPVCVPVEEYKNMLFLVRLWDKIKRISTDKDVFGEDPCKDIMGYCLQKLNNETKEF